MQQKSAADRFAPLFILTAGAMWGSMGLFVRVLGKIGCSSFEIVFLRSIVTAICLFLVLAVRDRSLFRVRLRDLWCFFGTGVLSIVFFNLCYFTTIRLSSLAVAAVLLYTAPAIVIVLSAILFQEKITSRKLVALILTLVGELYDLLLYLFVCFYRDYPLYFHEQYPAGSDHIPLPDRVGRPLRRVYHGPSLYPVYTGTAGRRERPGGDHRLGGTRCRYHSWYSDLP